MFMTSNNYHIDDLIKNGHKISFPDSMKSLMRGDLGQWKFWLSEDFQRAVLKDEKPFTGRPNEHLDPIDFEKGFEEFNKTFEDNDGYLDFISYLLYPKCMKIITIIRCSMLMFRIFRPWRSFTDLNRMKKSPWKYLAEKPFLFNS